MRHLIISISSSSSHTFRMQAAIDLDQAAFESQLALGTEESFDIAKQIYLQGGHSKSFAEVTLSTPLVGSIGKGAEILGMNEKGKQVVGKAYDDYSSGATAIKVQYKTTDDQVCLFMFGYCAYFILYARNLQIHEQTLAKYFTNLLSTLLTPLTQFATNRDHTSSVALVHCLLPQPISRRLLAALRQAVA